MITTAVLALVTSGLAVLVGASPALAGNVNATVDYVTSPAPGMLWVRGWGFDDVDTAAVLRVHVFVGGPVGSGAQGYDIGYADQYRPDVNAVYGVGDYHGIDRTFAVAQHGPQPVYIYFIGPTQTPQLVSSATIADVPPETTITTRPPASGTATAVSFGFTATEASTFQCRLDEAAWAPCTSPTTVTAAVGAHTFAVVATNSAGTPDPSPATYAFTVTAPPPAPPGAEPPPPPPPRITVRLKAVAKKRKPLRLRVDIDPDLNPSNYRFDVQHKLGRKWRTVKRTQTLGPKDVSMLTLPRGRYRVVVRAQHDMPGATATIRLKR